MYYACQVFFSLQRCPVPSIGHPVTMLRGWHSVTQPLCFRSPTHTVFFVPAALTIAVGRFLQVGAKSSFIYQVLHQ